MDKYLELMKEKGLYLKPFTEGTETAFYTKDVFEAINVLDMQKYIILGGDILIIFNNEVKYTYDNWYYNGDDELNVNDIQKKSIKVARNYLSKYKLEENNLVVFVAISLLFVKLGFPFECRPKVVPRHSLFLPLPRGSPDGRLLPPGRGPSRHVRPAA